MVEQLTTTADYICFYAKGKAPGCVLAEAQSRIVAAINSRVFIHHARRYSVLATSGSRGRTAAPTPPAHLPRRGRGCGSGGLLPASQIGALLVHIPPPLILGAALLANKAAPKHFLVEAERTRGAEDITRFGGWRGCLAARPPP
jgi:hypothetical protein